MMSGWSEGGRQGAGPRAFYYIWKNYKKIGLLKVSQKNVNYDNNKIIQKELGAYRTTFVCFFFKKKITSAFSLTFWPNCKKGGRVPISRKWASLLKWPLVFTESTVPEPKYLRTLKGPGPGSESGLRFRFFRFNLMLKRWNLHKFLLKSGTANYSNGKIKNWHIISDYANEFIKQIGDIFSTTRMWGRIRIIILFSEF